MKLLLLFFLSAILLFSCRDFNERSKRAQQRPVLTILGAGKPDLDGIHANNIIGKEYGLRYELAGGCTETPEFMDSLDRHNEQVYAQMEREFGKNWSKEFAKKSDSMEFLLSQAESFIEQQPDYKAKMKKLQEEKVIAGLWIEPVHQNDIFKVEAYDYSFEQDSTRKVLYSWVVDIDKRTVLSSQ